jgi:hypothetical protein
VPVQCLVIPLDTPPLPRDSLTAVVSLLHSDSYKEGLVRKASLDSEMVDGLEQVEIGGCGNHALRTLLGVVRVTVNNV